MIFAPDAPEQIGHIASAHPRLRLIIDHMGLPTRGPEYKRVGPRIDIVAPFAKYPNVAVKLSMVPGFSSEPYPFRDMFALRDVTAETKPVHPALTQQAREEMTAALTRAYNASGQMLFRQFSAGTGNLVFSPYSIGTAMTR